MAAPDPGRVRVERHTGSRSELRALFEAAEDSAAQLDSYLDAGELPVAMDGDRVVGHLQLVDADDAHRSLLVVATAAADIGNLRF